MKILHIVPSYLPAIRYGGPIQSVHNLNRALVRAGIEVAVYTTSANGPEDLKVPLGVPVDLDGVKVWYFKPGPFRSWFYSRALHKALKEHIHEFDLVHITSTFLFASALGTYYAKKAHVPCVISPRGNLMREPLSMSSLKKKLYLAFIERRNLARADAIHFTSEEEKRDYEAFGFPANKLIVVPNSVGVPTKAVTNEEIVAFRKSHAIPGDAFVFSCVGRISRIKGFDVLIPAFAEIVRDHPNSFLLVIGGDDEKGYQKTVQAEVAQRGIGTNVKFVGMVSGHEKDIAMAASDTLVQPSLSESFGMSSAEAIVRGIPVIVGPGVGTATVIREHSFGMVYRSGAILGERIANLKETMAKMMEDARARAHMRANEQSAADIFSEEKVAQKFISEYDGLIRAYEKN